MKPEFAISDTYEQGNIRSLVVDTSKAVYQGVPWRALGDFGKRKFENILILTSSREKQLKVLYV